MSETAKVKLTDYKYVDVWYSDEKGKSSPWQRIEIKDLPKFQQEEACNYNCFMTVQRFASKVKQKGEAFIAPLYFDLDYAEDPSVSQREAAKLITFFMNELDIQESDIYVYFSGSKGFHVLVSSQAIGVQPREDLHKVYKHMAGYLKYRLGDEITKEDEHGKQQEVIEPLKSIDLVVYTEKRMLRLNNSIHHKTRLFKIEVTVDELRTLTLDEIKGLAARPRKNVGLTGQDRLNNQGLRKAAALFYADKLEEYTQAAATVKQRYDKEDYVFTKDNPPVCVKDILTGGWKKDGDRNQATVQLACYFKAAGYTKDDTTNILTDWVEKNTSAKGGYNLAQRKANTRSVTEAVYSKDSADDYKFGCAFIRSLHGEKSPGSKDYERVPCAGELCPCLKGSGEDEGEIISLHLAATGSADLTGKLVKTKVMVAGKKHTPYIVPRKIEYSCWGRDRCKKYGCPLYSLPVATAYKDLGVTNRELVQMTATGDDNIKGILRELSGIPACTKFDTEVVATTNIDELLVIPMALTEDAEEDQGHGKYVLRRVYAVGNLDISENKYYELSGYVFPHPKNQESTILIKDVEPLQDVVDSFKLTDEVKQDLAVLQPADYSKDAIATKLGAILNDLTYNVTHIVERDETLLGLLLTYHSILRFNVPWDIVPIRGWVEMKIVGDTGTGKSAMIEKTMKYAGLGTRVNAESTSRTGLTYKMEQSGSGGAWYIVWGAWPLADKEFIWIDEDTGIEKDEYGEMTMARSDGKLEVKRAVTAETPCRVRAVLSGNVPRGKRLSEYGQGVECLKDIFNNEDIRRFDLGVFMRTTDVDPELYNQELPLYPSMITSDTLKNSILFAWSRGPEHVTFTAETVTAILATATELSKIYGNATDVPLVSPSDQRNKIARLAVALATLTHSVDESGERITVWPGHVEFIKDFLKGIYNAPGCGLNYYAKLSVKEEELTTEKYNKITDKLRDVDTIKFDKKYMEFITLFASQKYLRLGDVEAMLSIDKEEAKVLVNTLVKLRMLVMTSGGYKKTARFNAYIAKCFELGLFDNMEDDI